MRCAHCGDIIGTYEPVVVIGASGPRQTSGAAEPDVRTAPGDHFHRYCYAGDLPDADLEP